MQDVLEMASELIGQAGKPAYIEFSRMAKHMPRRSESEGRYVAIDVDMVTIRQVGSADSSIFEVSRWLDQNKAEVVGGRLPREHANYYKKAYEAWKNNQELPVEGTPIKGWAMISPAQAETILRSGVRTVEDLATMNAEAQGRIGMGAVMMKNKAMAWIAQTNDKGPLTMQMSGLQAENETLKAQLEKLTEMVQGLQQYQPDPTVEQQIERGISLADITDDTIPQKRGPGRPRKEA